MITSSAQPSMSLGGSEDRAERTERLVRAYDVMDAMARILWPSEESGSRDPGAVRWRGAIVSLHEVEDHLYVAWKDEDHWEKYAKLVELAWSAAGHESGGVVHENADAHGLALLLLPHGDALGGFRRLLRHGLALESEGVERFRVQVARQDRGVRAELP